ncbi:MAG: RNA polymerase sigma factor [Deltaproteobacteria bacterium]
MMPALLGSMRALSFDPAAASAELTTADVLERLRQGDSRALGEVYDQHHQAERAFAGRLLGDSTAAEDLVHEVFVTLPRAARRFRGESSLRSFLIGIAIQHARHHVRSASRRRAAFARLSAEPERAVRSPEASAAERRLLEAVQQALDELPLDQRVAFVLCDVEERSSVEAAELVHAPEATLRTRLFHARRKLRAALEKGGFR